MDFFGISRFLVCFIGIGLLVYVFYVELFKVYNDDYKVFCDISEYMSCLKVFILK